MKSNILIYVDNIEHISDYRKAGISAFLFALKDYSIGYNTYTLEEVYKNIREFTFYICEYYIQYNTIDYKCIEEFIGFISNYLLKESLQSILIWYNKNIDFIYSTNVKCISNIVLNCISEIIEKYRETIFKDIEDFFKK